MKFLRAMLPNLTIALNISMMVVVYLDQRNPMMGFLMGTPFLTLSALCAVASILTAIVLYSDWRRAGFIKTKKGRSEKKNEETPEIALDI